MPPLLILCLIGGYFAILFAISFATARKSAGSSAFFLAGRNSPWFVVAFGMIGTSLSGVTFISVPGAVGTGSFGYFQVVLGYLLGYAAVLLVLLPLYYRLNLTSIYAYLGSRLGPWSHKTGAAFFLLSRTLGASFRMYLVALVLHTFVLAKFGVPFSVTVFGSILLIWLYTVRGGMKTIIWTDNLQTTFMLASVVASLWLIGNRLHLDGAGLFHAVAESKYSQVFFWDWRADNYFWKQFASGAFITIAMTGLDQDMMQKNLSCRSLRDAQTNMFWFSWVLALVNLLFLGLGAMLYIYCARTGVTIPEKTDQLFPMLALEKFGGIAGAVFVVGIIAANYASADSALTALTTSFCVDFLGFGTRPDRPTDVRTRTLVHVGFSLALLSLILVFRAVNNAAVIKELFTVAGYTYGPLLGLFAFGMFTRRPLCDRLAPWVCLASPVLCYVLATNSKAWLGGYTFGFELLILNGLLTFLGLWGISRKYEGVTAA